MTHLDAWITQPLSEDTAMDKFEEIGRCLDEEVTRLRHYVGEEVAPETERGVFSQGCVGKAHGSA
jgi:hypothetical protein